MDIEPLPHVQKYMQRHWKSVAFLLIPVMIWGWLITSLIIWWMIPSLSWLESLTCAACVAATDPVLASSGVGKGKFARRIPKHLRNVLSAESGCNSGMASPLISLSLCLIHYRPNATEVFKNWFCLTVLYECLLGAIYGSCVGYAARRAIRWADGRGIIDRESFLAFYFALALWCAGTGSILGIDLLVGFCAGLAFSNDGWFAQKTEESHVSNVIDLLLNLAYFVYFGSIIPWDLYNRADLGVTPWRLVVMAILVILFRRIPIMVALKPVIPDIKTWREALFAGHFGPIGGNAIFVAIMARAGLETHETTPLARLPSEDVENYNLITLIWPITTFLVISSIVVHGSSVTVFALGKHINTLMITINLSFTAANEEPSWLARLPRLTPKTSMSIQKPDLGESSDEIWTRATDMLVPPGTLPLPGGIPSGFLTMEMGPLEVASPATSRSLSKTKRRYNWESEMGPGGPIYDVAITEGWIRQETEVVVHERTTKSDEANKYGCYLQPPVNRGDDIESCKEGKRIIGESQQGDVLQQHKPPKTTGGGHLGPLDASATGENLRHYAEGKVAEIEIEPLKIQKQTAHEVTDERSALHAAREQTRLSGSSRYREPAWAYRFDDNIIVEDENGEVIRRYKIPKPKRFGRSSKQGGAFGNWVGLFTGKNRRIEGGLQSTETDDNNDDAKTVNSDIEGEHRGNDVHFRIHDERGRNMSKQEFLHQLRRMDPHARVAAVSRNDLSGQARELAGTLHSSATTGEKELLEILPREPAAIERPKSPSGIRPCPTSRVSASSMSGETYPRGQRVDEDRDEETEAERRRREAALGIIANEESDSGDESLIRSLGVNFADRHRNASSGFGPRGATLDWAKDVVMGKEKGKGKEG